jgi:hypothetical protein
MDIVIRATVVSFVIFLLTLPAATAEPIVLTEHGSCSSATCAGSASPTKS